MDKANTWLKSTLDYDFNDPGLFVQALTHRSAPGESNERLEYLGDAVLDFVISEFVFRARPGADEGDLSRLRASLVNDGSLASIAAELGLGEPLILGSGEKKSGGHRRESILADALEALFGAVYLDAGFEPAQRVVERAFGDRLEALPDPRDLRDPKTRLQEWLQGHGFDLPTYALVEVTGKAHQQKFDVSCSVDGFEPETRGAGSSRRNAEQQAAERMLEQLADANT